MTTQDLQSKLHNEVASDLKANEKYQAAVAEVDRINREQIVKTVARMCNVRIFIQRENNTLEEAVDNTVAHARTILTAQERKLEDQYKH